MPPRRPACDERGVGQIGRREIHRLLASVEGGPRLVGMGLGQLGCRGHREVVRQLEARDAQRGGVGGALVGGGGERVVLRPQVLLVASLVEVETPHLHVNHGEVFEFRMPP